MASQGIKSFTSRVRLFLVGIVLALLVTNLISGLLVRKTLGRIQEEFETSVQTQARLVLEELGSDRVRSEMERWTRDHGNLPRVRPDGEMLRRHDLLGLHLLSPASVYLAGTSRPELDDPTQIYELSGDQAKFLRLGNTVVFWPDEPSKQDLVVAFAPILDDGGRFLGSVRITRKATEVRRVLRAYRIVLWAQLVAVLILLALVAAFSRWITKPILLVERTTAGEDVGETGDPTHFLLETYRKMIQDLKSKEDELRRLRGEDRARADRLADLNRSIVDSLPTGVVVVDADGRIRESNGIALEILRLEDRGIAGREYGEVLAPWKDLTAAVQDCLATGSEIRRTEVRAVIGGAMRWVELGVSRLRGEGRGGALLLLGDLTEIKELEKQMQRREMLADLGELSAGIAHEFRNALGTILGYARMLSRREEQSEEARAIEEEVHALEKVVRDFLRFADPTRLVLTELNLEALLRTVAAEAGRKDVHISVSGEFPKVRGDETLLRRTFRNLIRNAVEAIPEGGHGQVEVAGVVEAGRLRIRIEDNGPGVAEEVREKLFQPFFTTKTGGTGLGLALVQKIVLSHNGDIRYDPRPGGGSRFTVILPLQEESATADSRTA